MSRKEVQAQSVQGQENPLAQDFTVWSLFRFTLPAVIMMVFMGIYTMVDTIFVSRLVNTNALSAINIVCPVVNVIVGLGTMLATGGSALVAFKMGEGKRKEAGEDFTLIVVSGALLGVLISILGILFLKPMLRGLGASDVLFPYCRDYLLILLLFTPASILQVLFQNLIVTAGRPGIGLGLSVGAGLLNVMLDYVFMVPLEMGIAGSALATGIGYFMPAVTGACFFSFTKGALRFRRPKLSLPVLWKSCSNGYSEMVGQAAAAVTTFLFNAVMMRLAGEDGVAAVTIMIYSQFLLTAMYIGFSMGAAPVISYHYGRGNVGGLKRIFKNCLRVIAGMSVLVFVSTFTAGGKLAGIFSPEGTAVYEIAKKGIPIFSFCFLFCGVNIFTSAAFTALSNGKISAILSSMRTFVFITLFLLAFPALWGVTGVWLAVPAAEAVTLIFSVGFLMKARHRKRVDI